MEKHALADSRESTGSAVENLINRVFRCRHRRKTFPFTPRGEDQCYAVCLDCGQRLGSDLQVMGTARIHEKAPLKEAAPVKAPIPSRPADTVRAPVPQAAANHPPAPELELRNWKYDLLWIGLFAVGLSGGLYLTDRIRQSVVHPAAPERLLPPLACTEMPAPLPKNSETAPSVSQAAAVPKPQDAAPAPPPVATPAAVDDPGSPPTTSRLVSRSSLAVLGLEASAVTDLSQHPGRLADLIQSGSLFTVPSGTPIQVLEAENGALKVEILQGSMAGREGWVQAWRVTPRYRRHGQSRNRELRQLGEPQGR